ncbi:MAG: cupredoxin domain-containing protein [Gemmatimonadota bacterium]
MDRNRMIARSGVAHAATFALAIAFAGLVGCEPQTREPPVDQLPATGAEPAAEVTPGVDTALGTETNTTAAQQVVTIRVSDGALVVEPTTVRPGATTFRVINASSAPYDIDIDGPGPDREFENLPPGESREITMTLQAGTYEIEANEEREPDRERQVYLTVRE